MRQFSKSEGGSHLYRLDKTTYAERGAHRSAILESGKMRWQYLRRYVLRSPQKCDNTLETKLPIVLKHARTTLPLFKQSSLPKTMPDFVKTTPILLPKFDAPRALPFWGMFPANSTCHMFNILSLILTQYLAIKRNEARCNTEMYSDSKSVAEGKEYGSIPNTAFARTQ